jgi:hypothetical protein
VKLAELRRGTLVIDPYEDDDDSPTLQRPAPPSAKMQRAPKALDPTPGGFALEESSTDTELVMLDPLADAHTVDALPPDVAIALMEAPDYSDMETPKIPLDVAAVLLRASQDDDGSGT